jgi:hypothetical protein
MAQRFFVLLVGVLVGCGPSTTKSAGRVDSAQKDPPPPKSARERQPIPGPDRAVLTPLPHHCFDMDGNLADGLRFTSFCETSPASCDGTKRNADQEVEAHGDALRVGPCSSRLVVSCFTYERLSDNRKLWGCSASIPHCDYLAKLKRHESKDYGFVSRCEDFYLYPARSPQAAQYSW